MKRIDVAVLGATGKVGLEYLEMLRDHPWFRVTDTTGNSKVGLKLGDVTPDLPKSMQSIEVKDSDSTKIDARSVFSPLPTAVAKETEERFAEKGFKVITDASRTNRYGCPLLIPEVKSRSFETD